MCLGWSGKHERKQKKNVYYSRKAENKCKNGEDRESWFENNSVIVPQPSPPPNQTEHLYA